MNVLITGDRGYIGVEMVTALAAAGHDVVGMDIGLYDGCDFRSEPDEITRLDVDVRDVTAGHPDGFDAVVHLAALSNDPLGDIDAQLTYDVNLDGSVRLARAAKDAGVERFVFASSCSLYGAGGDGLLDEHAAFHPQTPYGESKVRAEQEISKLADDSFSPVYLRNATAYGASRRLRADVVVNNLVGWAVTTGKVLLMSDGTAWRPLVHIRDIIGAVEACLVAPRNDIHDEAFNVGMVGENYRIRDVAELVTEVVPDCVVEFAAGASSDTRNYRVDFAKIGERLPGFVPRWTVRDGIEELYREYCAAELTADDWNDSRYYRLKTVRRLQELGIIDEELRRVSADRPSAG